MDIPLNYLAILASAVAAMAIGAFWYSPFGFGKPWIRLMGLSGMTMTPEAKRKMQVSYALMFVGLLVTAYVLAHFVYITVVITLSEAFILGFWVWLGFIAPVMLGMVLWENRPWTLYLINVSYQLVNILVMSAILTLWV